MAKFPTKRLLGSLMYMSGATCPNISFAVSQLSQYLENPGEAHWEAVKVSLLLPGRDVHSALTYRGEAHELKDTQMPTDHHRHNR